MTGLKEWMTAKEIAEMKIPGMPHSVAGVHFYARRQGFSLGSDLCRKKKGTTGVEYHQSILMPAFADHSEWLTLQEIIDLRLEGLPVRLDDLAAKFRREGVEDDPALFRRFGQGQSKLYHRSIFAELENWLGPKQIAALRIPGWPVSTNSITRLMKRMGVFDHAHLWRKRSGKGGGFEFHASTLPQEHRHKARHPVPYSLAGPPQRSRLERRTLYRLIETFPGATEIRLDLTRPPSRRLLIKMPAPSRIASDQVMND